MYICKTKEKWYICLCLHRVFWWLYGRISYWLSVKFQSQLQASCMSSHTDELWYNESWWYIYMHFDSPQDHKPQPHLYLKYQQIPIFTFKILNINILIHSVTCQQMTMAKFSAPSSNNVYKTGCMSSSDILAEAVGYGEVMSSPSPYIIRSWPYYSNCSNGRQTSNPFYLIGAIMRWLRVKHVERDG